jgi:hypothetical protein
MNTHHTTVTTITDLEVRTLPADVALSTEAEARQRAEEIRGHLTIGFGKLTVARECRDDIALGYGSWWEYLEALFGDLRSLGLPPNEREHLVESLRVDAELSQRVIAERLSISVGAVNGDLKRRGVTVATVTGADGKVYTKPQRPTQRPAPFTPEPGMSKRAEVVARIRHAGPAGLTCLDIEKATGWRHGAASSAVSATARQRKIVHAGTFRDDYTVWVTPENSVIDAELVEDGRA